MRLTEVISLFKRREYSLALLVALTADALQIILLPFFAAGGFSPADTVVDLVVAVILSRLIGWHWAFLPSLIAEAVPALDLFPTWTAAVIYVALRTPPIVKVSM